MPFFSPNKALFLFFCVFWGRRIFFYLTVTECGLNIGNAGEMKLEFSCGWESQDAGDTRSMQVSSDIWTRVYIIETTCSYNRDRAQNKWFLSQQSK